MVVSAILMSASFITADAKVTFLWTKSMKTKLSSKFPTITLEKGRSLLPIAQKTLTFKYLNLHQMYWHLHWIKTNPNIEFLSKLKDQTSFYQNMNIALESKENSSCTFEENMKRCSKCAVLSCASKLAKLKKSQNKKPQKSNPSLIPCSEDNSEQSFWPTKLPPDPKITNPARHGMKKTDTCSWPSSASMTLDRPMIFSFLWKLSKSTLT